MSDSLADPESVKLMMEIGSVWLHTVAVKCTVGEANSVGGGEGESLGPGMIRNLVSTIIAFE